MSFTVQDRSERDFRPQVSIGAKRKMSIGHWPIRTGMEFEWDDAKNHACFPGRGFDFAYAIRVFSDLKLEQGRHDSH